MQAKLTPYDTGKVKIGLLYQPRQENEYSTDQVLLQKALLDETDSKDIDLVQTIVYVILLAIICGGLLHASS